MLCYNLFTPFVLQYLFTRLAYSTLVATLVIYLIQWQWIRNQESGWMKHSWTILWEIVRLWYIHLASLTSSAATQPIWLTLFLSHKNWTYFLFGKNNIISHLNMQRWSHGQWVTKRSYLEEKWPVAMTQPNPLWMIEKPYTSHLSFVCLKCVDKLSQFYF